jgi:hypothetical protein
MPSENKLQNNINPGRGILSVGILLQCDQFPFTFNVRCIKVKGVKKLISLRLDFFSVQNAMPKGKN